MSDNFAIRNARLLDPVRGTLVQGGIRVDGRTISALGDIDIKGVGDVIDAQGSVVAPGLIDCGIFKVDRAAACAGGITRALLMPDQSPPLDDPALVERAERLGKPELWVHPLVAATRGLQGQELAEVGLSKLAGAVGIATGRSAIDSSLVMARLLLYATRFDMVTITHAEDGPLTQGNVATTGDYASRMGLPAAPAVAEGLAVARDVRLAEECGARLHIRQVTTAESIAIIRAAKARGVRVTCGTTPPYFLLNDQSVAGYRTFMRLSPPLRAESDRLAVVEAITDGTIDIIASGHDPRGQDDKRLPFAEAEAGAAGMEILLPLALTLVHSGKISLEKLLAKMTCAPAQIFNLPAGTLEVGAPADLLLFNPDAPWRIDADGFVASAANTPFDSMPVQGRVLGTWKGGARTYARA